MIDLSPFLAAALAIIDGARVEPGVYRRYSGSFGDGLGPDPYGAADAANILYTLGRLPPTAEGRAASVAGLNALQSADGLWREETHHPIHTTAHCVAALELFDARPSRPLTALHPYRDRKAMADFLDGLRWRDDPWRASHQGAGLFAALVIAGDVDAAWTDAYVAWLHENVDPASGFWRRGDVVPVTHSGVSTVFPHLAGSFHYLFNLEHLHAKHPAPAALIDAALAIYEDDPFPLGATVGFAEIDWVYCLNRARRQSDHRFAEAQAALEGFQARYIDYLFSLDPPTNAKLCDLHSLFGVICALAELQAALPGTMRAPTPLRLVLDRRPFI